MPIPRSDSFRLPASIVGLFVCNGLSVGCYVGALPGLRARFALSSLAVALILLCAGACALVSMQLTGPWAERHGARRPTFLAPALMAVGLLGFAFAPSYPVAVAAVCLYGFGNGMGDVSMNALGVEVEQRLGKVHMGLFHGCWSLGTLAAALLVVAFGPLSALVWPPVVTGIALAALALLGPGRWAPESRVAEHHDEKRGRLPAATWLLGVMTLGAGFTEGTGFDWSSLHVAATAHVPSNLAALGLACMSGTMVTIRLLGDSLVRRWGRRRVVATGAAVAASGYLITTLAGWLPLILLGWLLVGLGCGVIAPQLYGLAGHLGGPRMLSVVVGFGYTAFLSCPAIIGALAGAIGLQRTMVFPLLAALVLCVLAFFMPTQAASQGPEAG